MWAFEHAGIVPDVVCVAKAIANGLPLSAIVSSRDLQERWGRGAHGSTYGGNPVACAAGLAVLETFREESLIENAAARGAELTAGLGRIAAEDDRIGDIRGPGLMVGVEFVRDRTTREPDGLLPDRLSAACADAGLLVLTCRPLARGHPLAAADRRHLGRDRRGGRDLRGDARGATEGLAGRGAGSRARGRRRIGADAIDTHRPAAHARDTMNIGPNPLAADAARRALVENDRLDANHNDASASERAALDAEELRDLERSLYATLQHDGRDGRPSVLCDPAEPPKPHRPPLPPRATSRTATNARQGRTLGVDRVGQVDGRYERPGISGSGTGT